MSLFDRHRRRAAAVMDSRQGVVDYAGNTQRHAVGWTERAWEAYQAQITQAALSYVAGTAGVSGSDVAGQVLPGIDPDASAAAGDGPSADLIYQVSYDKGQEYGLVGDEYQQYADYYWASNNEFNDELSEGWREQGASWSADQIADAMGDDDDAPAPYDPLDKAMEPERSEIPGQQPLDGPPDDGDPFLDPKLRSLGKIGLAAILAAWTVSR